MDGNETIIDQTLRLPQGNKHQNRSHREGKICKI